MKLLLPLTLFLLPFSLSPGCGLDWTLPRAHFEGVDEQGYVSYWEKIGEADLGDGLVIPVHINFNSHRESSSPTLGQGWTLPLLESHVEPVDENTLHVLMPDGWTFLFLRNGNTQTWRGNAGWVGETDGARFTATAPCGWRLKFDAGKIQEIDSPKNRTITIKYNGPAPLEADIDNQPFVQVAQNTATGVAESITIAGQKIALTQAQRPRISTVLGKTLLTGFDPALSQLQWPDGNKETFSFAAPETLTPSLVATRSDETQRIFTWSPTSQQILTDGAWNYTFGNEPVTAALQIARANGPGRVERYCCDAVTGITTESGSGGAKKITKTFTSGLLAGKIRSIEIIANGVRSKTYAASYDERGRLIRETVNGSTSVLAYADNTSKFPAQLTQNGQVVWTRTYRPDGLLKTVTYADKTETYLYKDDPQWLARMDQLKKRAPGTALNPINAIIINNGAHCDFVSYDSVLGKPLAQLWPNDQLREYRYNQRNQMAEILQNGILTTQCEYSDEGKLIKLSSYSSVTKKMVNQLVTASASGTATQGR